MVEMTRLHLALGFASLLGVAWLAGPRARRVQAVPDADPNAFWSIGKPDGTSDEFALGTADELTYEIGKSVPKQWHERQNASPEHKSTYAVRFTLGEVPAAPPVLAIDCYFLSDSPAGVELYVNGKRGYYRVQPSYAEDVDGRQAIEVTYSKQELRVPLPAGMFHRGLNEIGISPAGEGGTLQYDWLALLKSGGATKELSASVEPTIFFRRVNGGMKEITEVVVRHEKPLEKISAALKIGETRVTGSAKGDGYDFGEQALELEVPAVDAPAAYQLEVTAGERKLQSTGEFRPEKRWRLFAGLKIHNDIGFTDRQPNIQELDARNTDGVIEIASRFPFYKFNFEDGWLLDNYIHARKPERVRRLMDLALHGQVGVTAMYLNLLTGLCSGEELYRAVYFSKELGKKYGVPVKSACLTDAPSHTWFMPSLLRDVGVSSFANGSNQTRAPLLGHSHLNEDSPFYWEGVDGRRVLTWFARNYRQFNRLAGNQPTVDRLRRTVPQFLARYRRGDYPADAVMVYGLYGDNTDIRSGDAAIFKQWNETYEFPKLIPATDADYFAYIAGHFAERLPVFRGDAGSYWEDGAGSSAAETALNRDTQRLLPVAETAAALATAFEPAQLYPAQEFRDAWKNLLFYDEHTWGSSMASSQPDRQLVGDQWEVKRNFALHAHDATKDLLTRSLNRLVQNISLEGPTLFVFNLEPAPRSDVVQIELGLNQQPIDLAAGKPVPLDVVDQKPGYRVVRFVAENVPGFGYKAYEITRPAAGAADGKEPDAWQIESRQYRVEFDRGTGAIRQIHDKALGRDLVDAGAPYRLNELLYVAGGANSRIVRNDSVLPAPQLDVGGQQGAEIIGKFRTPFGQRIRIRARASHVPVIEEEVTVYDELKRIDIADHIQKDEVRSREAVYIAFPFQVSPPELAYQVQNTWVRPNADQLPGACREWFTTQNAVVARGDGAAVAWASPDAPLITLTDINRGRWLKSLDVKNAHIYSYAMNNYWFTNYKAAQGGDFRFRYFISSDRSLGEGDAARFSSATRSPLVAYDYYDTGHVRIVPVKRHMPAAQASFFKLDGCSAEVTGFKQAEDGNGFILRLHEQAGAAGACRLESPVFPVVSAALTNGVEENISALAVRGNAIQVAMQPHQFATLRLHLGNAGR